MMAPVRRMFSGPACGALVLEVQMPLKVWIDGRLYDKADAKISVYDHGLLYGDGVFEGIRLYHGRIFECEAHLRRLFDSAKAIRLNIPYTAEQLKTADRK